MSKKYTRKYIRENEDPIMQWNVFNFCVVIQYFQNE